MIALGIGLFLAQAGFNTFTATLPLALAAGGMSDGEIGLIVGVAKLVQLPFTIVMGVAIDRWGPPRLLFLAIGLYAMAALLLAVGAAEPGFMIATLVARSLQGVGMAAALPAALSLVAALGEPGRRGSGLAAIGSAHNLSMAILPLAALNLMGLTNFTTVALVTLALLAAASLPLFVVGARHRTLEPSRPTTSWLRPRIRRSWVAPLAISASAVVYWGIVTAFLPQRASAAGADVGLFFAADGLSLVLLRPIAGWVVDRFRPIYLVLAGLLVTAGATALLALPPTTAGLALAGLLTGGGGGLALTPLTAEMSWRSGARDRGMAFATMSAAMSGGMAFGSVGLAPVVTVVGFAGAITATIVLQALAAMVAVSDRALRELPGDRLLKTVAIVPS